MDEGVRYAYTEASVASRGSLSIRLENQVPTRPRNRVNFNAVALNVATARVTAGFTEPLEWLPEVPPWRRRGGFGGRKRRAAILGCDENLPPNISPACR